MGWFSTDYLKLDILMHLNIAARTGRGAIRWTPLAEHPKMSQSQTRIALSALNYGRLLVNQKETRADLFQRVTKASERLAQGEKEFSVIRWSMKVAGTELPVWPWSVESPEQIYEWQGVCCYASKGKSRDTVGQSKNGVGPRVDPYTRGRSITALRFIEGARRTEQRHFRQDFIANESLLEVTRIGQPYRF